MSNRYPGYERDTRVFIEVMRYHDSTAVHVTQSGVLTIRSIERLRSSVNGIPRWRLWLDSGHDRRRWSLDTKADASVGYDLANAEWLNCPVRLDLDGRGQVYGIQHACLTQDRPPDAGTL